MRIIIRLFAILTIFVSAEAQDREPSPWLFRWGFSEAERAFVPDSFQQKSMLLGFQWNGTRIMDSFLLNNTRATHGYEMASPKRYRMEFINQPTWWDRGGYSIGAWNAPFMNYEPTLYFENPADTGKILRPGDKSDPIFGFQYAKGTILSDTTNENYSRLVLTQSDKSSYGSDTVLKHIWPQPEFITRTYVDFSQHNGQTNNYLGRKWYLAVNLRRLDSTSVNTEGITDTILSIKIRYKGQNIEGNIKFDSLPNENQTVAMNYLENRGRMHRLQFDSVKTDSIVITNRMIPAYPTAGYKDITVKAAFFTCDPRPNFNNPPFGFNEEIEDENIDSIDIIVSYFGHLDVAIDYVRIESINAHYLLTGNLDTIATQNNPQGRGFRWYYTDPEFPDSADEHYEQLNDIGNIIQSSIDSMRVKSRDWQDASLFRFYFQDIECTNYYWWGPQRYVNLATNGMFVTRDLLRHPLLHEYYTKCPNRWIGFLFNDFDAITPAPYCRNGIQSVKSLGLKYGYACNRDSVLFPDTLNSNYETSVASLADMRRDSYLIDTIFKKNLVEILQTAWERTLYSSFYDTSNNTGKMLYSEKPWWMYTLYYNISIDSATQDMTYGTYRPKTAEETRLFFYSSLIRGAKGFICDGDWNASFLPGKYKSQMSIGDSAQLKATNNLYSDLVGMDFVKYTSSQPDTWETYSRHMIIRDTVSKYLQVPISRIYIGTKSLRTEIFKFNTYVRSADSLLMRLRLAATMSKGYQTRYNQDTARFGADTVLQKFISLTPGDLYTKKIWNAATNQPQQSPENWDSTFLDISLLRDMDDPDLTGNRAFIGLQNRRTDPLIYYYDSLKSGGAGWELRFFSAAEIDLLCTNGGPDPIHPLHSYTPQFWQQYWWRRIGAREVNLKFDYRNPADTNEYCLLRITELDKGTSAENEWWRKEPYYSRIDTVIGQDSRLAVKLLPSEGKILSIEVLHPPTNLIGKLDNSNQSKLIAFPVYDGTRKTDSIRYHLVYYRPGYCFSRQQNIDLVYYTRSRPVWKDSQDENIVWEQEICISDMLENLPGEEPEEFDSLSCRRPSIVVRRNADSVPVAYIVYSCEGIDVAATGIIGETMLEINGQTVRDSIGYVQAVYATNQYNPLPFGNPCINASANCNYYAWSDFFDGIVASYKFPDDIYFRDTVRLRYSPGISGFNSSYCSQPSMNVYSNIENGDDNCSIVWQEVDTINIGSVINYSRLRGSAAGFAKYIPKNHNFGSLVFPVAVNNDTTIACINYSSGIASYPAISRKLVSAYFFNSMNGYNKGETVVWQEPVISENQRSILCFRSIELSDSANIPITWHIAPKKSIRSLRFDLYRPSISNTMDMKRYFFNPTMTDPFIERIGGNYGLSFNFNGGSKFVDQIAQFPLYSNTLFMGDDCLDTNFIYFKKVSDGHIPHLSNYPYFENNRKTWTNRQVFEYGDSIPPYIWASAKGFYRKSEDDFLESELMVGFRINNDSMIANYMITLPKINEDYTKIFLPYDEIVDTVYGNQYIQKETDTLLTDWFIVGANAELTFKLIGRVAPMFGMYLEKQNDTAMTEVLLPESQYDSAATFRVILLNGLDENYRIVFINKNIFPSYYTEELYIGGIPISDTFLTRKGSFERIVNLNPGYNTADENRLYIIARPNPANDKIEVRVILQEKSEPKGNQSPSKFRIALYSVTGEVLYSSELNDGKAAIINTESYMPGSYFLRAEEIPAQWGAETANPAVEKIIIER